MGKDWNNQVSSLRVVEATKLEAEDILADWIEEVSLDFRLQS